MQALKAEQIDAAARTLTASFWNDPLVTHVIAPDEKKREAVCRWFFSVGLRYGLRWGDVRANDELSAVAVWLPPDKTTVSALRMLRVGFGALPFRAGLGGARRMMTAISISDRFHHKVNGPHWYLWMLGTAPEAQGTGQGGGLLRYGTSQADAAGIPCYLETGTESNVAFYSRRGFAVIDQADILGFTVYAMVRPPQAPG
jgi:ribosomal protein S18 acetylase RimI-like enzyme